MQTHSLTSNSARKPLRELLENRPDYPCRSQPPCLAHLRERRISCLPASKMIHGHYNTSLSQEGVTFRAEKFSARGLRSCDEQSRVYENFVAHLESQPLAHLSD